MTTKRLGLMDVEETDEPWNREINEESLGIILRCQRKEFFGKMWDKKSMPEFRVQDILN